MLSKAVGSLRLTSVCIFYYFVLLLYVEDSSLDLVRRREMVLQSSRQLPYLEELGFGPVSGFATRLVDI